MFHAPNYDLPNTTPEGCNSRCFITCFVKRIRTLNPMIFDTRSSLPESNLVSPNQLLPTLDPYKQDLEWGWTAERNWRLAKHFVQVDLWGWPHREVLAWRYIRVLGPAGLTLGIRNALNKKVLAHIGINLLHHTELFPSLITSKARTLWLSFGGDFPSYHIASHDPHLPIL